MQQSHWNWNGGVGWETCSPDRLTDYLSGSVAVFRGGARSSKDLAFYRLHKSLTAPLQGHESNLILVTIHKIISALFLSSLMDACQLDRTMNQLKSLICVLYTALCLSVCSLPPLFCRPSDKPTPTTERWPRTGRAVRSPWSRSLLLRRPTMSRGSWSCRRRSDSHATSWPTRSLRMSGWPPSTWRWER